MANYLAHCDALDIPYEDWSAARVKERLLIYDMQAYHPAKRPYDADYGASKGGEVAGGVFFATAGYVTDPALATHNLQCAAEAHGARFRFNARITEILQESRRISDVKLADGLALHAPVVINVGGAASFLINAMAGVTDDMTMTTRAL
ncbi:MAG: FAD-dependent oxidoreductase [Pseudomonadota bacterium]|nr:FAD-dependent oxidoreductase [Pseudomonadota bacterium]